MELKLSQSSLPSAIFNSASFFPKHFTLLVQKWKIDIQRISWKDQSVSKKILVHVVKEGETLSSISNLYGVPIPEIASANEEIADADLVYEGQHLYIPSANDGDAQLCQSEGNKLRECLLYNASPNLRFLRRQWNQILTVQLSPRLPVASASPNLKFLRRQWNQIFTVQLSHRLPLAKTTGSYILLVPLIAFCIGCIMCAFQSIVAENWRRQAAKKTKLHHHRSHGVRWRTALSDLGNPDSLNAESKPDSDALSDDQEQLQFEDVSHDFTKLEGDYQKFLAECGMSNWGYWRGGSPQ